MSHSFTKAQTLNLSGLASDDWPGIFNKVIDQHRPRSLLVIVGHVVIDHQGKVQEEVPCILRYGAFMVFLRTRKRQLVGGTKGH